MNNPYPEELNAKKFLKPITTRAIIVHGSLFIVTFLSCMIAGALWAGKDFTDIANWHFGLTYAILIMTFLTAHEFGHYFAARKHEVDSTLPYFIPMPLPQYMLFGTFGAVIKTRTPIPTKKALFDIGVSGPIAGFVVCCAFLIYGLLNLPMKSSIYLIHPNYLLEGGIIPNHGLHFGDTIFFTYLSQIFANPKGWLPPMNEIYHYPFLCVGWFGLFVTSLNMLPIGQLDGGHVTYALFGNKQRIIARIFWWFLIFIGIGAMLEIFYILLQDDSPNRLLMTLQRTFLPSLEWLKHYIPWYFNGWGGWLFWAIITKLFIKLDHPVVDEGQQLDTKRKVIAWIAIIILLLSFSYNGLYLL